MPYGATYGPSSCSHCKSGYDDNPSDVQTIQALQEMLVALGYPLSRTSGLYGRETTAAVTKFQTDFGLSVDGRIGPTTATRLQSQYSAAIGSAQRAAQREAEGVADLTPYVEPPPPAAPPAPSTPKWVLPAVGVGAFGLLLALLIRRRRA